MPDTTPTPEKVLTLSTRHMPNTHPNFGDLRVAEHGYGYILFLVQEEDRHLRNEDIEWLGPVIKEANALDCTYINFDRDAEEIEGLPKWDW